MLCRLAQQHRADAQAALLTKTGAMGNPNPEVDLTIDSSQDSQGENDQALRLPQVQYTVLSLPEKHQRLLDQMQQEQTLLLRNTANVDAQVSGMRCSTNMHEAHMVLTLHHPSDLL